jgi:membrane protein required for colicin V production
MNVTDIVVIAVLGLSALAAFSRGFVREVLAVGSWVAAALATIYLFPVARPLLRQYISYQLIADALTGAAIFVITLAVCATLSSFLSRNIRGGALGAVDRSLGLLFGLIRGAILVCLAYMFLVWLMPKESDRPAWLQQARSLPMVATGAEYLRSLVPPELLQRGTAAVDSARKNVEDAVGSGPPLAPAPSPAPAPAPTGTAPPPPTPDATKPGKPSGYTDSERKDLNRLLQGTRQANP